MHTASFPFMKINSVFQMSLRRKKPNFSSNRADKNYIGTADFYLLDQLSILLEILERPVTTLIDVSHLM